MDDVELHQKQQFPGTHVAPLGHIYPDDYEPTSLCCVFSGEEMWNFINFHLRRLRERSAVSRKIKSPAKKKINKSKFLVNVYNNVPSIGTLEAVLFIFY
jgi:hypothetical protein